MPPCTENEPHNIFHEDLLQGTSFIDLLQDSSGVNVSGYMSDEEPLGLPSMLPSEHSPIGGSVNVLDMINQDMMFGSLLHSTTSNASTEVTYSTQSTAPSTAPFTSAGDVFLPSVPITTTANTFVKPFQAYVPPSTVNRTSKTILNLNSRRTYPKPATSQSTNPFMVNPFVSNQNQLLRNPFAGTSREDEKDRNTHKSSSSSSKKSKSKSHGAHKSAGNSKSTKNISRSSSKLQSLLLTGSSRKTQVPSSSRKEVRSTALTHTVTRPTNIITDRVVDLTTDMVTHATTDIKSTAMMSDAPGAVSSPHYTTSIQTSTTSRTCASTSISPQISSTYLPTMLYSAPIISRTPTTTSSPAVGRVCERFAIVPAQTAYAIPGSSTDSETSESDVTPRACTRLVIPVSLNAYAAATADMSTTRTAHKQRVVHALRSHQQAHSVTNAPSHLVSTTTTTSTVVGRTLTRSPFALPGPNFYATRKCTKSHSHTAVTTEPQTFTIIDGKGAYTTLTISSNPNTTTGSPLVMTQTRNTTAVAAGVTNTSPVASDTVVRPRSQLLIPIANSQMDTNTSLGYLVTSPAGSDIITSRSSAVPPSTLSATTVTTSIASHTITTISSEALKRIRSRLIYNVSSTTTGLSMPTSTVSAGGNRPRGPVTIIANRLISAACTRESAAASVATSPRAVLSAASTQGVYAITAPITSTVSSTSPAEPATRPVNRVVIPINVHPTSTTHSSVSSQGTYLIAGVGASPSTAGRPATRPSRVVIPIIHNSTATVAPTPTPTAAPTAAPVARTCPPAAGGGACSSSIVSTDVHSKLRNRLTIHVSTTASSMPGSTTPITAYTITRSRAPQSVHPVPAGSTPYVSPVVRPSEGTRSPATMTLITFSPPATGGSSTTGATHRSPSTTRGESSSPTAVTCATPTISSTGNRFVIKLASGSSAASGISASSVTSSITTPITSTTLSPKQHQFVEPHSVSTRLRTFPGPRTYSIAQRIAAGNVPQRPVARNVNPRVQKAIANPSPLQIFADVVSPPTTAQAQTTAVTTQSNSKSRHTLSHSPASSTVAVPHYKNTVFKNWSTVALPNAERTNTQLLGSRASSERLVLNRSVALVSSRRSTLATGSCSQRHSRSLRADSTPPVSRASPILDVSTPSPASNNSQSSTYQDDKTDSLELLDQS